MANYLGFSPTENCHARRHPSPDPWRTMPDPRPVTSGVVETGDGPRPGAGSRDDLTRDLVRDLAQPWPTRRPAPTGRPQGRGSAPGSVGGAPEEDTRVRSSLMRAVPSPPLPFLGTGPERAHQRPGASVLPEGHRLPPGDGGAGAGGGDRLHRRPRKVLGVRTPAEVFARGLAPP